MRTLNIIGAGHVGSVFGRVFAASGCFVVQDVLTRSLTSAQRAVTFIGAGLAVASHADLRRADVYLLAVGDDQIEAACAALVAARKDRLAGAVVFHCSGALSSQHLRGALEVGALVASVHPIRSFADPQTVAQEFGGTWCGVEGDAAALAILEDALRACGARPVAINADAKTVYHAAAVFASNYLVTLLDVALRAYQQAGIPEDVARQLAQPLVTETVANAFRLGPAAALSGPIARGDLATVARQQRAVEEWDAPAGQLYQALVAPTLDLVRRKG
jgi:predicted short-subunit dehydrogenase-like oxidoreductase (DUF2520 family)